MGLDLGEKHVITKVGWSPRVDHQQRVELALFEGANEPDFSDALPIYIVKVGSLPDYIYASSGSVASDAVRRMVTRIVKDDPAAKARLVEIWETALAEGGLSDLNAYLDEKAAMLQESQELNFKRWKILDEYVHMNFQALGSYEAEVGTVRTYITERLKTFDQLVRR